MKKVTVALLCALAVNVHATQPNWMDLIDSPNAGKWQIDTNSIKRKGDDVQAWVKIFPSQATLEKRPNQPVTTAHFKGKCGAPTLTVDAGVNYNPDGTAWTTSENFVQPVVPGSVWEGVVDIACHKRMKILRALAARCSGRGRAAMHLLSGTDDSCRDRRTRPAV
jgi:hypothetical protein